MGNTTSSKRRVPSINNNSLTVDLFSSDTTNQLIQLHVSSQNITDILNQSITLDNEENQVYNSLIDQDTITARVWAAQCKIYGFGTEKNVSEGFRELLQLKQFKEAFYPIACYYYEKKKYDYAYHYFYKLRKDNHFAQYRIALMLFRGQGTLINHEKAFRYMKLAASNNNKYAQFILGFYYEHGVLVKQSISTAKLWYERSANQGFSDAQLAMANLLLFDLTQLQDDTNLSTKHKLLKDEALDWLYKAIEQENASAYIRLGALHEEGIVLPKDISKAIENYEKAVNSPLALPNIKALGHYLLGVNYRIGDSANETLAFQHLTASSNAGYAPAQRALGLIYAKGIGTHKNDTKAKKLLQKAASQGDIRSLGLMADDRHNKITSAIQLYERAAKAGSLTSQLSLAELYQRTGQLEKAFQWFDTASRNTPGQDRLSILDFNVGFVCQRNTAQLMVARYRYNGWGVKRDPLLAFQTFQKLSENGFADAHYWLAACYEEGIRSLENPQEWLVQPNLPLAFEIYMQSANSGDMDGQFQVAYMLSNGLGIQKDTMAAFIWYQKAAEKGHTVAQYSMGMYYEHGLGVPRDLEKAKEWYQLAADKNSQLAMVRLAKVLVLLDSSPEAIHWLKKAVDLGNVPALRELAAMYKNGLIMDSTHDYKTAFDYYQKAAEQDDAPSWYALSEFYQGYYNNENATVVPEDFDEAVKCLKKAVELGYTWATIDLADLYHRQNMTGGAMKIYMDTANEVEAAVAKKARIEAARIAIYENYGDEQDKLQIHNWLAEMITDTKKFSGSSSEIFELLGYCSENGIGTMKDKDAAIQFYIDCINENESNDEELEQLAKQRSLCRLVYNCMEQKNYSSAYTYLELLKPGFDNLSQLKSSDAKKHARCMKYYFGYLLMYGLGTEKNIPESVYWFSKAAEEGEGSAFYELGYYYSQQDEDAEDIIRDYYEQGVAVGHAGCMRQLALLLLEDETDQAVLDEDYDGGAEILDLLKNASKAGDVEATYHLGRVYENGLGDVIPVKDIEKALEFYLEAAEFNNELSIMKAGEITSHFTSRHEEAIELFRKADLLFGNIKAKVMLISYNFQGFYIKEENDAEVERNDVYNFKKLQAIIDKEVHMMNIDGKDIDKSERKRQSIINKDGLGLAFYILGQCYELGRGTLVDINVAKEYYFHAVTMSEHIDAMWRLGVVYKDKEKNEVDALQWFRRAAEKGKHCESHYQLGLFHLNGLGGLEKNVQAAKKYFSKAVEQGHPLAMFELGQIVWNLGEDYFYAYELYKTSGEQFHVPAALRELGHLAHTGFTCDHTIIVQQNYKAAFAYYCQAAQTGDAVSALMIGNYFEEGYLKDDLGQNRERALQWYESAYRLNCGGLSELAIGKLKHTMADTIRDPRQAEDIREEAFAWFESAAEHLPAASAKIMVALYYLNGWGRKPRNTEIGFHMLSEIADSGGDEAYIPVAQCYEEGIGTEYDMSKALTYWTKAADLDSPEALFRIGEIYELGLNGVIDKKLAAVYYQKANVAKSKPTTYHRRLHAHHSTNRDSQYSLDSLLSSSSTSSVSSILSQ